MLRHRPLLSTAACSSPFLWMKLLCMCVWRRFDSSACANTQTETGIHTYTYAYIQQCVGFFMNGIRIRCTFLLPGAAAYQTHSHSHTHRQTPILLIPRQTQICCFMNDYQEQQLNFRCALLITSFFRLPFFLSWFAVCLFLDNTNVLVSINVRAPISRKVNAATVPRAHEWTTLFVPLYLAVSLSPSLPPSLCLSVCLL